MNIEALPKILFLNQESEEMQDRRIRVKVEYDTTGTNPVKKITKKINNTIELTEKLHSDNQVNCLAYSNKYGLLVTCLENQILITDSDHLESYIVTSDTAKKSLKQVSSAINFSGKVYLSPDETKVLAVNHEEFLLFDLNTQQPIWRGPNELHLRQIVFVTSDSFAGWNFQSDAFLYENITEKLSIPKLFEGIEMCTSVNVIQNHLIVCEKINQMEEDEDIKVVIFDNTASSVLNEINLRKYGNPDNYVFEYTQVLSIFSIKHEKQGEFSDNDVYGLVLGYYDDQEYEPDRRYLNFMKGNIVRKDADLKIRAFELFLSPTEDRSFFYNEDSEKIPFEVQIITCEMMRIIMIEHLEIVFVVDSNEPFEKLKLYTLQPAHEIKLQGNKYFKGICLMKNMLEAERKPPTTDSNETCNMICRDFEGEFMSLYFPAKETELTVSFPSSLLILGDDKISRRYAIETYNSVEEYETEKIKEKISVIYKARKQQEARNTRKIEEKKKIEPNKAIGEIKKSQRSAQQKIQEKPKEEQKKPSLFGTSSNISNLFSTTQTNTLTQTKPSGGTSLFATKPETSGTNLFASKPAGTSLFESKPSTGAPFFDNLPKPVPGTSIFDQKPTQKKPQIGLFAKTETKQPETKPATGVSIFGKPIEEAPTETKPSGTSIFGQKPTQQKPQASIFAQTEVKQPQQKPNTLFSGNDTKPLTQNFLSGKTTQTKTSGLNLVEKKPEQSKPTPIISQTVQQESLPVKKSETQSKEQKKPINLDKLKQLGTLFGHTSVESIPAPLLNLSEEQIDALIAQMSLVLPKKQAQPKKSPQQLARQKLLKEEHFAKIVDKIDETKNYLKTLKQTNQAITSPTIFTLSNAKELVKSSIIQAKEQEIKTKNPLANLVKNYAQRMEFLQKQYLNLDEGIENRNPNNVKVFDQNAKKKEQKVKEDLQEQEKNIQYLVYYQQKVFPQKKSFFNLDDNSENYDQKLTSTINKKAQNVQELMRKVGKLLEDNQQPKMKESRISSVKSSSILTVASRQSKKKGLFAFSLESSSSSDQEISKIPIQKIYQQDQFDAFPNKKTNVLIKFKPKSFNLIQQPQNLKPLVKLVEFSNSLLQNQDEFNPAELFRAPSNNLQSSMKKSINFKDKIPLKKDDRGEEEKIKKLKKFGFSQDFQDQEERKERFQFVDENSGSEEEDIVPDMSRSLSKFPQNMMTKKGPDTTVGFSAQNGIQIKKTTESDIFDKEKLKQQTKSAVSAFGPVATKVQSKVEKKESKSQSKPSTSLFGNLNNTSLFGAKKPEDKPVKIQESKGSQPQPLAKKGVMGTFQGKKITIGAEAESGKQEKPISLIGNLGSSFSGSRVDLGSRPQEKPKSSNVQKKEEKKVTEKKEEPKVEKKETGGLFGLSSNPATGSLFGQNSLFSNPPAQKLAQQINFAQPSTKPSEPAPKPTQKLPEQLKTTTEKTQVEKKQQNKPTGLFGTSQNKGSLFGNNTTSLFGNKDNKDGLFGKKDEQNQNQKPKEQKPAANKSVNDSSIAPSFAGSTGSSLFGGATGSLFGKSEVKKEDQQQKPKAESQLFCKPAESQKKAESVAPSTKLNQVQPTISQQSSTSLFGASNQSAGGSLFNQPTSVQNTLAGGFLTQTKPAQTFGATNRFMSNQSQPVQSQQNQAFKPMDASFAPGSGFNQAANTGLKSFASVASGNQSGGLFGQNLNQPQGQGSLFGQSNPVANPLAGTMNQPSNQTLFSQQTSGQGMFGSQQSGGLFGGVSQQQNQGGNSNFLSGFNASQTLPVNPVSASNPSMFKARK